MNRGTPSSDDAAARDAPDRRLSTAASLGALAYDERGLVPVVAQDAARGAVLMVAWANREALARSLDTGELHFWSRSRAALWRKGETSGSVLRLRSLHGDCDGDVVLALVDPMGPACHTGDATCFGTGAAPDGDGSGEASASVLQALWRVLESRERERPEGSYTVRLLRDENLRVKKLGEETAELVLALARGERDRARSEAADVIYHLLVALLAAGVTLEELMAELASRRG